ncbi:MAG: DUF5615 family PIN-like protein [Tepidisphaeraceae bacterium]|jgi:predicted nuclease of predicted toxin-antitoxin system
MRFLADMGVSQRIVQWLRQNGHDAVHLRELGLRNLSDQEVFEKAAREQRIILTFDLDFGEILALSGERVVSVVLFRMNNTTAPLLIQRLQAVFSDAAESLKEGAVVVVEDARHRVRRLPLAG